MTPEFLLQAMPLAGSRAATFAQPLTDAMARYQIVTPQRQAAFLAQVCHESGSLHYTAELADGRAYEGRRDLGNTESGDGVRFKGRGLIQVTGRTNYLLAGAALSVDFVLHPERMEEAAYAALTASWFWNSHALNRFADIDQFGALTKAINGGYNGIDDRISHWLRIRKLFDL